MFMMKYEERQKEKAEKEEAEKKKEAEKEEARKKKSQEEAKREEEVNEMDPAVAAIILGKPKKKWKKRVIVPGTPPSPGQRGKATEEEEKGNTTKRLRTTESAPPQ